MTKFILGFLAGVTALYASAQIKEAQKPIKYVAPSFSEYSKTASGTVMVDRLKYQRQFNIDLLNEIQGN